MYARTSVRDLTIMRRLDAPQELVWKNWTEAALVKRWWGPRDFTAPYIKIDLRVGGKYLYCMRSPNGKESWSTGVYRQIAPPKLMVCTDSFADEKGTVVPATFYGLSPDFPLELLLKTTFDKSDAGTLLTLEHSGFPGGNDRDSARAGWEQSLDKLEASLDRQLKKREA